MGLVLILALVLVLVFFNLTGIGDFGIGGWRFEMGFVWLQCWYTSIHTHMCVCMCIYYYIYI